jgi:hypothetical protein
MMLKELSREVDALHWLRVIIDQGAGALAEVMGKSQNLPKVISCADAPF